MSLVKELLRSWLLYEVRGEEIFGEQLPWVFESFGGREMVGVWLYRNILACASCIIFLEYGGYGPMADSVIPLLNCFGFADCFFCPNILLIYKKLLQLIRCFAYSTFSYICKKYRRKYASLTDHWGYLLCFLHAENMPVLCPLHRYLYFG